MRSIAVGEWEIFQLPVGTLVKDDAPPMPIYAVLCRGDRETIVLDTGSGVFSERTPGGYLPTETVPITVAIEATGVAPSDVSTVVISHLDTDHIGGVVTGTFPSELAPALSGARVVMLDEALEFARNGPRFKAERDADVIVGALDAAGVPVVGVADGAEVAPGVFLRAAPGHRAANAYVDVTSGGDRYVFVADVFHGPGEFSAPRAPHGAPFDADAAAESRVSVLASLGGDEILSGAHLGFGRVEPAPGGGRWTELDAG